MMALPASPEPGSLPRALSASSGCAFCRPGLPLRSHNPPQSILPAVPRISEALFLSSPPLLLYFSFSPSPDPAQMSTVRLFFSCLSPRFSSSDSHNRAATPGPFGISLLVLQLPRRPSITPRATACEERGCCAIAPIAARAAPIGLISVHLFLACLQGTTFCCAESRMLAESSRCWTLAATCWAGKLTFHSERNSRRAALRKSITYELRV